MKGIDIASMQGVVDFAKVKATGIEIVYIKATEGLTYNSPTMLTQYNGARAAGLKIGFYHYLRANNAVAEAKHFLSVINGLHVDCLYGIDAEQQSETVGISARCRAFADYLISQGKQPCLYTGLSFYNTEILPICKDIPLWVANYCSNRPSVNSIGWQYSGDPLDLDIFDDGILLNKSITINNIIGSVENMSIKQGENSRRVSLLQAILNVIFTGSVKADGDFGPGTLAVVMRYQKAMGLTADGIVGPATITMLIADIKNNYFKL